MGIISQASFSALGSQKIAIGLQGCHLCWIIGQQTIAERNVDGVEFRMKQTKYVLCTLKNLF